MGYRPNNDLPGLRRRAVPVCGGTAEVSFGGVKAASKRNPPSTGRGILFYGSSFFVGSPDKRLKNFPAGFFLQGHLRVPLDRPEEGLAGQVHRLDEIIRAAGHLYKPWCQGLDRLVVAAVHAQLLLL